MGQGDKLLISLKLLIVGICVYNAVWVKALSNYMKKLFRIVYFVRNGDLTVTIVRFRADLFDKQMEEWYIDSNVPADRNDYPKERCK